MPRFGRPHTSTGGILRTRTIALILAFAALAAPAPTRGQQPRVAFRGVVYDLDFSLGRNRVVAQLRSGNENLIADAASAGLVRILQTALSRGTEVAIDYEPGERNRVVAAHLERTDRPGSGQLVELGFDEAAGVMTARVRQEEGEIVVMTADERAQAILQCAIDTGRAVDELRPSEDSRALDRVKLTILR